MNHFVKKTVSLMLVCVMLFLPMNGVLGNANATTVLFDTTYTTAKKGIINVPTTVANALNARADANSASALVATIPNGTTVEVIGEKNAPNGSIWYRIRFTNNGQTMEAYAFHEYIKFPDEKVSVDTYASPLKAYVDYSPAANVRTGPSSGYAMLKDSKGQDVQLINGTKVKVLEKVNVPNAGAYYKCSITVDGTEKQGYLFADFVRIYEDPQNDDAFVAELKQKGFPDSYIEPLRILHQQHPTWTFQADVLNLDWKTAWEAESAFQRSLVNYVSPTSWKRVDDLGYTWLTSDGKDGGFKKLDGAHWEAANATSTGYFMDPRNFLTESEIFQFEVQSYDPQIHTLERIQNLLQGTFMSGNVPDEYWWASQTVVRDEKGKIVRIDTVEDTSANKKPLSYAEVFLESAKISGVSPDMLVARVIQEMGTNGTSVIISGNSKTAPGHYNYYDFGTYATATVDAITNGLNYAKQTDASTCRPWNTRWKALYGGAIMIGRDYITRGQDTLYYQKFNVCPGTNGYALYSHQYMTNIQAPSNEARTMWQACPDLNAAIVFKIPVYQNMPENTMPYPEGNSTANPNPYLKELSVDGYDLTPGFNYKTFSYDINVDTNTDSIVVRTTPIASTTRADSGKVTLKYGDNEIRVTSIAAYGNSQEYVLHVYRPKPTQGGEGQGGEGQGGEGQGGEGQGGQGQGGEGQGGQGQTPEEPEEHIKTKYTFKDNYLLGINPGTTIEQFKSNFTVVEGGSITFKNHSGAVVNEGVITTGFRIETPSYSFVVLIYGDVNCDGDISIFDMLYIKRQMLEMIQLDAAQSLAADVKDDGLIDIFDMLYIKRHMLDMVKIAQPAGEEKTYGADVLDTQ